MGSTAAIKSAAQGGVASKHKPQEHIQAGRDWIESSHEEKDLGVLGGNRGAAHALYSMDKQANLCNESKDHCFEKSSCFCCGKSTSSLAYMGQVSHDLAE